MLVKLVEEAARALASSLWSARATARSYLISSGVLGALGTDASTVRDRVSAPA